ncbi:hypothetical protein HWV62_20782 [Athelia sp. TMB]|nr:hypothetical protein HWV62_20782 [Athelia sp. TMB]
MDGILAPPKDLYSASPTMPSHIQADSIGPSAMILYESIPLRSHAFSQPPQDLQIPDLNAIMPASFVSRDSTPAVASPLSELVAYPEQRYDSPANKQNPPRIVEIPDDVVTSPGPTPENHDTHLNPVLGSDMHMTEQEVLGLSENAIDPSQEIDQVGLVTSFPQTFPPYEDAQTTAPSDTEPVVPVNYPMVSGALPVSSSGPFSPAVIQPSLSSDAPDINIRFSSNQTPIFANSLAVVERPRTAMSSPPQRFSQPVQARSALAVRQVVGQAQTKQRDISATHSALPTAGTHCAPLPSIAVSDKHLNTHQEETTGEEITPPIVVGSAPALPLNHVPLTHEDIGVVVEGLRTAGSAPALPLNHIPLTREDIGVIVEGLRAAVREEIRDEKKAERLRRSQRQQIQRDDASDMDGSVADTEDENIQTTVITNKARKGKKPRTSDRKIFCALVRSHGESLMGRDSAQDYFNQVASVKEVESYDPTSGPCCTSAKPNFRVDIRGFPRSPWNISCAKVFAQSFYEQYPQYKSKFDAQSQWITHFEHLRGVHKRQLDTMEQRKLYKQKNRRAERKRELYDRRYAVARRVDRSHNMPVEALLLDLGIAGMSSDESDHERTKGVATYRIRHRPWRSLQATTVLRTLDSLHLRERYHGAFEASAGAWPRLRLEGGAVSNGRAVAHMRRNAYDEVYLAERNSFQISELNIASDSYTLKVPLVIRKEAAKYDTSNPDDVSGKSNNLRWT